MKKFLYMILLLPLFAACGVDGPESEFYEELITLQAKDIFHDCATVQGEYHPTVEPAVKQGFVVSTQPFGAENAGTEYFLDNVTENKFEYYITGLEKGTDYYVKAFIEKESQARVYGNEICFHTETFIIVPPGEPEGEVTVIDGKTASVMAKGTTLGNENLTNDELKSIITTPADYGAYVWTKEQGRENAARYAIGEDFASVNDIEDLVTFEVEGLTPDTEYSYVLFIRTVSNCYGRHKIYSREVESEVFTFTTPALIAPAVETGEVENVTSTSVTMHATLKSNGNDPDSEIGIEIGEDKENLDRKVLAQGFGYASDLSYSVFVSGLKPQTTYWYRAFAKNGASEISDVEVKSFITDEAREPVLERYDLDYEYRFEHFTKSSIVLRAKLISDGGSSLTAKGFIYGSSKENLDRTVDVSSEIKSDGVYDYFEATISDITSGMVYYKPFAENAKGKVVLDETCEVMTVIDGGQLYNFDRTTNLTPICDNMYLTDTRLEYLELDPIVTPDAIYYLLDRNIGALRPYSEDNYFKTMDNQVSPEMFESAGYYYQFDRPVPSATPDLKEITNIGSAPWNWTKEAASFNNPKFNTDGDTWTSDNCPEGYEIPTLEDFTAIINAIEPETARQTLPNLFEATRFGTTGSRAPANGNMTNKGLNVGCEFWVKDAGTPTVGKNETGAKCMKINGAPSGTFNPKATCVRFTGRPIRCVRKVAVN